MSQPFSAAQRFVLARQDQAKAETFREPRPTTLCNERTFYRAFIKDLLAAKNEVIIYSPFVTRFRSEFFRQTFATLRRKNVAVFIVTRPIAEHDVSMQSEASCALREYEALGAHIAYVPGQIHEKAAVIDRQILWEGSLNILSQRQSREMMRRIPDEAIAAQVMTHLNIQTKIAAGYRLRDERLHRTLVTESERRQRSIRALIAGCLLLVTVVWLLTAVRGMLVSVKDAAEILSLLAQ